MCDRWIYLATHAGTTILVYILLERMLEIQAEANAKTARVEELEKLLRSAQHTAATAVEPVREASVASEEFNLPDVTEVPATHEVQIGGSPEPESTPELDSIPLPTEMATTHEVRNKLILSSDDENIIK